MITSDTPTLKPPLKWAGGKRWLVPKLAELWLPHSNRIFIDLFCGGLSVSLGLNPKSAICNDTNPHLINFYKWVQTGLDMDDFMFGNDAEDYCIARAMFNLAIASDQVESEYAARLFYYLNRTGFNGLCRFNKSGLFNVPFGKYKSITYAKDFAEYRSTLYPWSFVLGDYREAIASYDGCFIYADPPYDCEFTAYSGRSWQWSDQVALAEWLAVRKCPVVASNAATDRIVDLYKGLGFAVEIVEAPRRISCNGDRTPALEILATKNLNP